MSSLNSSCGFVAGLCQLMMLMVSRCEKTERDSQQGR